MIVVDSSVLVQALVGNGDQANDRLRDEWIAAPQIIDLESLNAVKRLERSGIIDLAMSAAIVDDLRLLPMDRYEHWPFLSRCWELRHNLSIYDASYVALAEALEVPLVTADRSFAAAPALGCKIELLADSDLKS